MLKEIVPRVTHAALLAVEKAGFSSPAEGAKVSYEEKENRGKTSAENLRVG
jgi:CspA family cold shock protein